MEDYRYAQYIEEECHEEDIEYNHERADDILLEILEELGYYKTIEAFRSVSKQYGGSK